MVRLYCLLFSLLFTSSRAGAQKVNDTFSVYFELNVAELSSASKTTIDSLLYLEKINNSVPVSIIGYADYLATDEYNLELSHKRASNVREYLTGSGIRDQLIKLLIGRGEVKRADTLRSTRGIPEDRRVDIVMEYVRSIDAAPPVASVPQDGSDTFIVMRPSEKLVVPPSSSDPGFSIEQVPTGKTFILKNIYFPMGRHFPKQTSYEELDMLLEAMLDNPGMAIRIEGHVCCISNNIADAYDLDSHQLDLSVNRARFIFEYLKARGVAAHRLSYVGYGKSKPIYPNEQTQEEAATNRRVEIRILAR